MCGIVFWVVVLSVVTFPFGIALCLARSQIKRDGESVAYFVRWFVETIVFAFVSLVALPLVGLVFMFAAMILRELGFGVWWGHGTIRFVSSLLLLDQWEAIPNGAFRFGAVFFVYYLLIPSQLVATWRFWLVPIPDDLLPKKRKPMAGR